MDVVRELLRVARMMATDLEIIFLAESDHPRHLRDLNDIYRDMNRMMADIAEAYGVEFELSTQDKGRAMSLSIAVGDHSRKRQLLDAILKGAMEIGEGHDVEVVA